MSDRRMRMLVFNLATDADDPVLGFTTAWIEALAARSESVDVVTMRAGRFDAPPNVEVHSVGKEKGWSEPRRALRFYRVLGSLVRRRRYDVCFAHMMPLFAVLGAPVLKAARVPIVLWYAHGSTSRMLRLAERVSDVVVTSTPEGFRIPSSKVRVVGQGIDTRTFRPGEGDRRGDRFVVSSVGRLSPVKRLDLLVDALALARDEIGAGSLVVRIVGPLVAPAGYLDDLRRRIHAAGLDPMTEIVGRLDRPALVDEYRRADVLVNVSETGSLDKTGLEAMACGVPVIASNPAYSALLADVDTRLVVEHTPHAVARALIELRGLPIEERARLGERARAVVVDRHDLDRVADLLVTEVFPAA